MEYVGLLLAESGKIDCSFKRQLGLYMHLETDCLPVQTSSHAICNIETRNKVNISTN